MAGAPAIFSRVYIVLSHENADIYPKHLEEEVNRYPISVLGPALVVLAALLGLAFTDIFAGWPASITAVIEANAWARSGPASSYESSPLTPTVTTTPSPTSTPTTQPTLRHTKTVTVTTTAEGGSARPEIVATTNRVFVLYLGNIATGSNRTFNVKVYDSNMDTVIASRVLVSTTAEYGGPTDIRVASDGQYLYAFYETHKPISPTTARTYLWGAKYTLDDSFDRVAYTSTPIVSSRPMSELDDGGELLDDPAPLVGPATVFVVTRLKYSLSTSGRTVYRVREFNREDLSLVSQFDLDLSNAADGRGRVTSLLPGNNSIYIALATTVSDQGINENNDDGALSDIVVVRMRPDWTFTPGEDVQTISAEPNDRENYVSGFKTDGSNFYITYKQAVGSPPTGEQRALIKVFDQAFNPVLREQVRSTVWGPGGGEMRPSLEVLGNRVFSGQSSGQSLGSGNAEVYVYEITSSAATTTTPSATPTANPPATATSSPISTPTRTFIPTAIPTPTHTPTVTPTATYTIEAVETWVTAPNGNQLYTRIVRPASALYPGRRFPALIAIPGGIGAGAPLADNPGYRNLAASGFVLVAFNPEGRGTGLPGNQRSQGTENCNGFTHQDDLKAIVEYVAGLPNVDTGNIGVETASFGIAIGAGALGRYPTLPVAYLVDQEGPHDSRVITFYDVGQERAVCGHLSTATDPSPENVAFWAEREAVRHIGRYPGRYLRMQAEVDHAQGANYFRHAIEMINAATRPEYGGAGSALWTRMNGSDLGNPVNQVYTVTNSSQYPAWVSGRLSDHPGLNITYDREMAALVTSPTPTATSTPAAALTATPTPTASVTPTASPTRAPYESSPFGFHPASVFKPGYPANGYVDATNIGVHWAREGVYAFWFLIQADLDQPVYDFTLHDRQWRNIPTSLRILANIAPQGQIDEGRCLPGSWLPVDEAKYIAFVRATVERYDGDGLNDMPGLTNPIKYWQIGNEPDERIRSNFASLQRITYPAIKEACPDCTVLIGGVAGMPANYLANFVTGYAPILAGLGGRYVDRFDFHWYGTANGEYRLRDTVSGQDVLNQIRATLTANGFSPTLPLWITEMGSYSGDPAEPMFPFQTERQQAGDYFKRFIYSLARGVEKVFPAFGLMEGFKHHDGYFDHTGLIYDGQDSGDLGLGVKKLGYYTYKKMTEKLEGADWSTLTTVHDGTDSDHLYLFRVTKDGRPIHIAWWDYFDEPGYTAGSTKLLTLTGLSGTAVTVTLVVPAAGLGRAVTDYTTAFTVTTYPVANGSVTIALGEDPVLVEEGPEATPTPTPTSTPTRSISPCVRDANANGIGDVGDIQTAAADLGCLVHLPLVAANWRQPWPTLTPTPTPTPNYYEPPINIVHGLPL